MYRAPLYEALQSAVRTGRSRFHTPGHGGDGCLFPFPDVAAFDMTEIEGLDALYEASGPILCAEELAARFFGAQRTLLSSGGCTLCIQTMLALALQPGEQVLMARNSHRAAIHTAALLDLQPVWVWPQEGRILPSDVENLLERNPSCRAVYITSPDYYGRISDIAALSAVCRTKGIPLLVDNAHGTHLGLVPGGRHPLQEGAAMTACSAHKTLPVLTAGAWLNIAQKDYVQRAKQVMAVFGSTSPSYPILASLDLARAWCEEEGKAAFATLYNRVKEIEEFACQVGMPPMDGLRDNVRITLQVGKIGLTGVFAADILRRYGVEPEFVDEANIVLIPSVFSTQEDFQRLQRAIAQFPQRAPRKEQERLMSFHPESVMSLRSAVFSHTESIDVENAPGRIAAQAVCPCPPGIPITMPGERVTDEICHIMKKTGISCLSVVK